MSNLSRQEFALISGGNVTFNDSAVVGGASFWNLLNLTTGSMSTWALDSPISEIVFVGPDPTSVMYIDITNLTTTGSIGLYVADVFSPDTATLVASLPAPYAGLKAARAENGDIKFLLYSLANPDGSAYNPVLEAARQGASTARIYDSTYARVYVRNYTSPLVLTWQIRGYSSYNTEPLENRTTVRSIWRYSDF